jgi:ABC-type phosphate/phosphonate transport system substrate-binding protein
MASFGYLQDASTIVMALKSEKVKTNQITTLVESSTFPRAIIVAKSSLANETKSKIWAS